jgi:HSP20 family protein
MLSERRAGPIPVDAYRRGNEFTIHLDLPGVDPRFIAVTAEKDLLAVRATRAWFPAEEDRIQMTERPQGDSPPAVPR